MEIEGKRVLVTGANRGLGRALALACLGAGAREVLAGARQTAIRAENIETPIGDAAREVMDGLASDPLAIEMSFAEYRP